jgi:hypothetical protein
MKSEKIFSNKKSERGIAEESPIVDEPQLPDFSVEQILDALGQYFDQRLNVIEQKLDECLKK